MVDGEAEILMESVCEEAWRWGGVARALRAASNWGHSAKGTAREESVL